MIRVVLADDEELIRVALAALLDLEDDIQVVGRVGDGRAAVMEALRYRPDVAVVDLEMPGLNGMGVASELLRALPGCAVIVLTGKARPVHLERALKAGARAFVVKGAPASTLADVIRRVHTGQRYVDPALAADALTVPPCPLSPRELEIVRLSSAGEDTAAIARHTHLAAGTLRNYLAAIQSKLGVTNRHEAVQAVRDSGWL
ncbi:response regulator transcription factor [Microbacterium wangchenii]|uniref:response regulator transcription factor n=1 Tax=Microbacterium wangchenii TaxID=2541726 RepID=UPI0011CC879E|nr:response regulator transcription factor [Microbacterium wangchenii]TXK14818.1 response regulator transcription factor [Microbacterium wangchenii]